MSSRRSTTSRLVAEEWPRYLAACIALIAGSCLLYLAPLVVQVTIDGAIASDPARASRFVAWATERLGGADFLVGHLWIPALIVVGITALAGGFTYLRGRWSAQASEAIVRRLRDRVYDHLQRLPCSFHDRSETGDLIQRCTSDVETVRMFLSTQVVEIGRAVVMLLVPIPLMLAIDVRMTIASLVLVPPVVAFAIVFFTRIRAAFKETDEAEGRMTTTIQENLTGIRVVRAFARQAFENRKLGDRNAAHRGLDYRLYVLLAWYWAISDLMCFLQKALVLGLGAYLLAAGELQVGVFFYFLTAVSMFIWPVRMMGRILADLSKATVALGRIEEILAEPMETVPETPLAVDALRGGIDFEGVSFSHGNESPVLHDVSFRVEPGQTLALLGPSGCGKSTIVNLLLRLYDHEQGSIRLDGHAIERLDRRFVRAQMAVVMQEPFLYSRSLRENIAMGRPGAAEEELVESASVACVDDAIREFEHGYDTVVGERGVTLSGGQRQRVALARALLAEPAVLILDDALSAVDTETESMILDALQRRRGRQTTIVVAHRLSTLMHADLILVMDGGRIVQSGTHEELLQTPGLYRRLWAVQNAIDEDDLKQGGRSAARHEEVMR
ncbi:MAG: ABC transporter ATP-binding protein [Planctomycetota bacterium]|jgi:ATP-binding cassette subfamily B protein